MYAKGKAAVSGLGEAVFNRALADPSFVRARLAKVEAGSPRSAQEWSRAAFAHTGLELCWSPTDDGVVALALEHQVIAALDGQGLWNVRIAKPPASRATRKGNSID